MLNSPSLLNQNQPYNPYQLNTSRQKTATQQSSFRPASLTFGRKLDFSTSQIVSPSSLPTEQQKVLNAAFQKAGIWQRSLSTGISSLPPTHTKVPNGTFESEMPELMSFLGLNSLIPLPLGDTSTSYQEGIGNKTLTVKHPAPYSNGNITIAPWLVDPYVFTTPAYGKLLSEGEINTFLETSKKTDIPGAVAGKHIDMDETHQKSEQIFKAALSALQKQGNTPLQQEWEAFKREEQDWLLPYSKVKAIGSTLKDQHGQALSPNPEQWPEELQAYVRSKNPTSLSKLGHNKEAQVRQEAQLTQFEQFIAEKAYRSMVLDNARQGIGVGVDITTGEGKAFTEIFPKAFLRNHNNKVIPFGYDGQPWNLPSLDITSQEGQDLIRLKMRRSLKTLKFVQEQLKKEHLPMPPFTVRLDAMHTIFGGLGYYIDADETGKVKSIPVRMSTPKHPEFEQLQKFSLIDPNNLQHLVNHDPRTHLPVSPENPSYLKTRSEATKDGTLDIYKQLMTSINVPMDIIKNSIQDAGIPDTNVCYELLGPPNYFVDEYGKGHRFYMWTQDEGSHESIGREKTTNNRMACYGSHDKPLAKGMIKSYIEDYAGKADKPRVHRMLESLQIPEQIREERYYKPIDQFPKASKKEQNALTDRLQELELAYVLNNTNRAQLLLANLLKTSAQHPDYVTSKDAKGSTLEWLQVPGEYSPGSWSQLYSDKQLQDGLVNMPRIMKMVLNAKVLSGKVNNSPDTQHVIHSLDILAKHFDKSPAEKAKAQQTTVAALRHNRGQGSNLNATA